MGMNLGGVREAHHRHHVNSETRQREPGLNLCSLAATAKNGPLPAFIPHGKLGVQPIGQSHENGAEQSRGRAALQSARASALARRAVPGGQVSFTEKRRNFWVRLRLARNYKRRAAWIRLRQARPPSALALAGWPCVCARRDQIIIAREREQLAWERKRTKRRKCYSDPEHR
jgi:hypothetical protein